MSSNLVSQHYWHASHSRIHARTHTVIRELYNCEKYLRLDSCSDFKLSYLKPLASKYIDILPSDCQMGLKLTRLDIPKQ